ncbi:stimulated by retinoic acid gene 6 protein-like isoform X3 [Nematostella vectensis]|uniref:stimulated by retinoic acid gene 6 protein-like isoform X3 n=1 Tax=Nematostella vectensis TaxID=45351 RepID=UPI0020773491|nr:stimulated by retinoic acid gene 6 protein-like isoform X3 [Nematostella vectensis]
MSSETPETECSPFNTEIFDLACLGPAFAILIGLSFFVKRKNSQVCRGRFGVLIPMNFLQDHHKNRLVFAMVFGAVSGSCINLAVSAIFGVQLYAAAFNSPWKKAFTKVAMVLLYVVLNYPFFACLSTNQQLVGAILGMAYTLLRLVGLLVAVSYCTNPYNVSESTGILQYSGALEQLPVIICHIILFLCFCRCLTKKILKRTEITNQASRHPSVAEEHDKIHVRLLLRNQLESSTVNTDRWYIKLLKKIYTTRTDFKFSTQIVSMFAVIAVSIYAMTVAELVAAEILRKVIPPEFGPYYQHIWHVIVIDSCIAAAVICTTLTILQMLHFAKCHRDHVLLSFKTRSYRKPSHLVGQSLSYCGFQIGYTILSMIILFIFLLLLFGIMAITVLLLPRLEEKVKLYLKNLILSILPVLVVTVLIMVIQKLLTLFVFRDRQLPDVTVTIDNQRLFCVMSLVFFMNNVIVGIASAVSRGLKSLILGFVFLPRIDRTPLMQQYQYWDKGYLSYVGFINVLKAHSHPVMLVFCQLLLNATWQRHTNNAVDIGEVAFGGLEEEGRPPVFRSRPAANRWFVAVTLLRNPGLAKYRKSDDLVLQNALERNKMQRRDLPI